MSQENVEENVEQLVDLFRNTLQKGHRYVLCVECASRSTLRQTNIEEETDVARLLEKFARRAREAA
jgi:predicted peroxiredoxin